jgi:hypothetical protein
MSTEANPFENRVEGDAEGKETVKSARLEVLHPSVVESLNRAEIDVAIATAKRWPRDIDNSLKAVRTLAVKNGDIAATCSYGVPRAGKVIVGPSVHYARIVATYWGNINALARVVDCDHDNATCQGVCHDMETNYRFAIEIEWPVQPPRNETPERWKDQMGLAKAAGTAVAFRRAVYGCLPWPLFRPTWKETQMVAAGKGKSFDERKTNMFAAFKEVGVSESEVWTFRGYTGKEALTQDDLIELFALLTAINDKTVSVEEVFGPRGTAAVKAKVPTKKEPKQTKADAEQPKESNLEAKQPETQNQEQAPPVPTPAAQTPKEPEQQQPKKEPAPKVENILVAQVKNQLDQAGVSEMQFLAWLRKIGCIGLSVTMLSAVSEKWLRMALSDWTGVLEQLKEKEVE